MTTEYPGINVTGTAEPEVPEWLYIFYNSVIVFLVIFVMTAMGCGISWTTVKPHLRRPVGPAIGRCEHRSIL